MNFFQQSCPSCNSLLELPIEADGKSAVCPGCQTQFIATAAALTVNDTNSAQDTPSTVEPAAKNRNQSSTTGPVYQSVSIESVLGDSRILFFDRRRPMLLPFLIPSVVVLVGFVVPLAYLSDLAITSRTPALIWLGVLSPWFLLVMTYAMWFALNLSVGVCDVGPSGQEQPKDNVRSWFIPDRRAFIALLIIMTAFVAVMATVICVAIVLIHSVRSVRATEIRIMVMIGASLGAVIGMTLFATRFWPLIPMTIEGRFGARCIQEALTTTRTNLLTSFLMVIALIFCIGVGFSLVGLGLPIAIPFTALTLVAALRMMEGRSIPAFEQDAP